MRKLNKLIKRIKEDKKMKEKTIAAISTPIGVGGISIVRLSGSAALHIALQVFSCNFAKQNNDATNSDSYLKIEPRRLYLGKITTQNFTEKCLMVYFISPYSYTGEDVIEFQCHGGLVIAQGILQELIHKGATLASPGEFTKRAFINGKLTLDEAEGVIDMINAESESEVRAGYNLLEGSLSRQIKSMQDSITQMLAKIEVTLDYPEVDYEEQTSGEVLADLKIINDELENLIATSGQGMLIKNGTRVLILGKPNVGKSSLLNSMLNFERAIVTSIQGTTRDTIEETYVYNGAKFVLTDTAGVRESSDEVEKIGITKAKKAIDYSDIVLLVLDGSEELSQEDHNIISLLKNKKTIVIINKTDLPQRINLQNYSFDHIIKTSTLSKKGIKELKQKIYDLVIDDSVLGSNIIITNLRHKEVLMQASVFCSDAINSIYAKNSLDLVTIDIQNLWLKLGEITGETNNEEIINRIFSSFCLGK